jgi:hypothetical protein
MCVIQGFGGTFAWQERHGQELHRLVGCQLCPNRVIGVSEGHVVAAVARTSV